LRSQVRVKNGLSLSDPRVCFRRLRTSSQYGYWQRWANKRHSRTTRRACGIFATSTALSLLGSAREPSMRRREFIAGLGGAAAWPLASQAQQAVRMRRIGVLSPVAEDDPASAARLAAFVRGLQELGWSVGRNIRIDYRWGVNDLDRMRSYAAELVGLEPEVLVAAGGAAIGPLSQASRTLPIVFDDLDFSTRAYPDYNIQSLARPGGNATGFLSLPYTISGKWLELLKQIAPRVTRAAVLLANGNPVSADQLSIINNASRSSAVEIIPIDIRDPTTLERRITGSVRELDGGMILTMSPPSDLYRGLIINLAARNRLPAVYPFRYFVAEGGLISYGADRVGQYRQMAGYVDRVLKGENPANLPLQLPTKYQTVLNLKTAKEMGLSVSQPILQLADEVIE
jgi:putative tryptophan/tyrosine transport system substrate-binding protein